MASRSKAKLPLSLAPPGTSSAIILYQLNQIANECSRGIGAGIAILLAKRGANIVVNYVSEGSRKRAQEIVDQIRQIGTKAILCQASLMKLEEIPRLIEAALEISDTGKIEILVHK